MPVLLRKVYEGFRIVDPFDSSVQESLGTQWVVEQGDVYKSGGNAVVFEGGDAGFTVSRIKGNRPTGFVRLKYGATGGGQEVLFLYEHATLNGYYVTQSGEIQKLTGGTKSTVPGGIDVDYPSLDYDAFATNVGWFEGELQVARNRGGGGSLIRSYSNDDYVVGNTGMSGRFGEAGIFPTNLVNHSFEYYETQFVTITGLETGWKVKLYYTFGATFQILEHVLVGSTALIDVLPYQFATFPFFLTRIVDADDIPIFDYEYSVYPGDTLELIDIQSLPFPRVDANEGWREFQEEMDTPEAQVLGASIQARPDALSRDFKTAYSYGPVAIGDTSQGLIYKLWRIRFIQPTFYISYSDNGTTWSTESALFTYPFGEATEIDLCFEQNGRPVVTWVGASDDIWLYWFNPFEAAFVQTLFAHGRTPTLCLDDPEDVTDSDVILFYVSLSLDRICYREQSDNYAIEHKTGVIRVQNLYLERARRTRNYRLQLAFFLHYPLLGKWTFGVLPSALYNINTGPDELTFSHAGVSITNIFVMYVYDTPPDEFGISHSAVVILNYNPIIEPVVPPEGLDFAHSALTILNYNPTIPYTALVEALDLAHSAVTITNIMILILDDAETEGLDFSHAAVTITNAVP